MYIRSTTILSIAIFGLGSLIGARSVAQPKDGTYYFVRLSEENGLSNNVINDIAQDTLGFIWVATDDGLFRYDGSEFESFRTTESNRRSIPNNVIQKLHVDSLNNLWILSDYGIGRFSYAEGFISPILQGTDSLSLHYKSVTSIVETSEALIFGTFGGGLSKYSDGFFEVLTSNDSSDYYLPNESVSAVHAISKSRLLIGTWGSGLLDYNLQTKTLQDFGLDHSRVFDIHQDVRGDIWVGTENGIILFQSDIDNPIFLSHVDYEGIPDDDFLSIESFQDHLLVGTRFNGLMRFKVIHNEVGVGLALHTKYPMSQDKSGPSSNTISTIFIDREENIWLGTHNGGINFIQDESKAVLQLDKNFSQSSLSYSNIWGIAEKSQYELLLGTDGNGIDVYDFGKHEVNRWKHNHLLPDLAILTILVDQSQNTWVGTYKGGILYIGSDGKSKVFNDFVSNDIRCIRMTEFGEILIGTNGGGAYFFDSANDAFRMLVGSEDMDVRDLIEGDNGVVWLATFGNGLIKLNRRTHQADTFNWWADTDIAYTPIAHTIYKSENHIWLGTKQAGLVHFDMHTEEFTLFGESDGLSNNSVRSIISDERGHLWLSTNVGVSVFNIANMDFINFIGSGDFQRGRFNDNSGLLLSNGRIAFGGIYGMNVFTPSALIDARNIPKLVLKEITVIGDETNSHRSIANSTMINEIVLEHDERYLDLDFAALAYPFNNRYNVEVNLTAYANGWQQLTSDHSVAFQKIPTGIHELQYRLTDGIQTGPIKSLTIVVNSPWYNSPISYFFYLLSILSILWLIMRYNNKQVKLKEKLQFEKISRAQENREMDQRLRFFTNFSHEMRTPLTLITSPVDDLINNFKNDQGQVALLHLIRKNGKELSKLINRLLEFRKLETENTILNIGFHDIKIFIQEEIESFQYHASHKNIEIHFATSLQLQGWLDIEKLHIVVNNLLSNCLKYANEGGNIWVELKKLDDHLIMRVSDDGIGIDTDDLAKIFDPFFQGRNAVAAGGTGIGLSLCQSLVKAHGGNISAKQQNPGLLFKVEIPILKSRYQDRADVRFIKSNIEEEDVVTYEASEIAGEKFVSDINERIMVIADDHKDIAAYLSSIFQNEFKVLIAKDGLEALSLVQKYIPDIVISDVMMPELQGTEVCKAIRSNEQTSHIPIILLTAKDSSESVVEGYDSGADAYITKPFSRNVILSRVKNLIESRNKLKNHINESDELERKAIEETEEFKFLKKVEELILLNLDSVDFSVLSLAKELGYSRTSLYRKIKALTDQSINQFIRSVKMKRAAELLTSRNTSVSEVAFSLGFTDLKYFRSCFKDHHRILPSDFQKSKIKDEIEVDIMKKALDLDN